MNTQNLVVHGLSRGDGLTLDEKGLILDVVLTHEDVCPDVDRRLTVGRTRVVGPTQDVVRTETVPTPTAGTTGSVTTVTRSATSADTARKNAKRTPLASVTNAASPATK